MLVEKRIRKNPETITPEDYLAGALVKICKIPSCWDQNFVCHL
jgi:hypothetical protein